MSTVWVDCESCEACDRGKVLEASSDGENVFRDWVDCGACDGTGRLCQDRDSVDCTGGAPEHSTRCAECEENAKAHELREESLAPCPGAAHGPDSQADNCGICAPRWGWVPVEQPTTQGAQ